MQAAQQDHRIGIAPGARRLLRIGASGEGQLQPEREHRHRREGHERDEPSPDADACGLTSECGTHARRIDAAAGEVDPKR
ncbi:MAG: hypothetical protein R2755_12310 [Acidimicrobiales bacterium]